MNVRSRAVVLPLAGVLLLWASLPASAHNSNNHPADDIYQPSSFNGWRIYLSPAHHYNGPNYGCGSYVEDDNMPLVAQHAAHITTLGDGSLQDRGYRVRVGKGDPDDNIDRSNNWDADRHIAMHSNASGSSQCGGSGRGTRVFYRPGQTQGEDLAEWLNQAIGDVSPGSPDYIIASEQFDELVYPTSKVAFLEAEFHDWTMGKNWLIDYEEWSWRIGYAVDSHLGYP